MIRTDASPPCARGSSVGPAHFSRPLSGRSLRGLGSAVVGLLLTAVQLWARVPLWPGE